MSFVIVPNVLRDAINAKLDAAYVMFPDAAADRDIHYQALLDAFNQTGAIPDFTLEKRAPE
jgi:hypothetical protein